MFGCSEGMLRAMYEGRTPWGDPLPGIDPALMVISMLSDVQELMSGVAEGDSSGQTGERLELARQIVNRAKFGVLEYLRRPDSDR